MTTSLPLKDTHPTQGFTSITQLGLKALHLATIYKAEIEERLPGAADTLSQDLDALDAAVPGALQKRHESVAATAAKHAWSRQGHARVRAIRRMIRKAGAPREVQKAYGVGHDVSPPRIRDVTAALQQIVDRAGAAPEEAAELGLSPAAVAELKAFLASLTEADKAQEKQRASAPLTTKERNRAANRVAQRVALIAGAGMLAFADNPPTYASFEALLSRSRRASKAPKKIAEPGSPKAPDSPIVEASGGTAERPVA